MILYSTTTILLLSRETPISKREKLVRAMAYQQAVKSGKALADKEMQSLINDLFACAQPNTTAGGNPTYIEFKNDYLEKLFGRG